MVWKPLTLSAAANGHLPPLLVSALFTDDAYTIHLTDLTHLWTETLDRRAIIRRSRDESTSIDPSSGDQLVILLDKIKSGLAGKKGTTSALTILDSDTGRSGFVLNIHVELPGGLAPLEWPIRLSAAPQTLMTSQLIIPLMRVQQMRLKELAGLREVLREKDHVIQKIADKLEASGTEFGEVFPQAAGKAGRKVDRRKAEERVRGLAVFDYDHWKKGLDPSTAQDTGELIGEVFSRNGEDQHVEGANLESELEEDWWESIKGITINLTTGKFSTKTSKSLAKSKQLPKPVITREESSEQDDFQVQATPPHLAKPKHASTDEDEHLDATSQRSKIPDSFVKSPTPPRASTPKPKKLGKIGGKKSVPEPPPPVNSDDASTADEAPLPKSVTPEERTPPPPSTPVEAAAQAKKGLGKIGGKKELLAPPPGPSIDPEPVAKEPTPEPVKPKKGKLGQIGGKKRKDEAPAQDLQQVIEAGGSSVAAAIPVKKKLGMIGGRKRKESPADADIEVKKEDDTIERGRGKVKEEREVTPPPRETSTERADKKREQLKKELEEKAKAPVKKKRKF